MRPLRSILSEISGLLAVMTCLAVVMTVGCGEPKIPTGTVKGTVTLDGESYGGDAAVTFLNPDTGQAGAGNVQPDGTFSLQKPLPAGSYVVFVGPRVSESPDGTMEPGDERFDESLPQKYRNESTSDIKIDIVEGENDVAVPLKK